MDSWRISKRLHGSESEDVEVAESDGRDRLSELPESLILVILSLLQMTDVVRTTILSKRWKNLWITVPCLDFWNHSFKYDLHDYQRFIYGALAQWKGPMILKFTITCPYFLPRPSDLDSWLLFAIDKQVEELSLNLGHLSDSDNEYFLPQPFYSCSWIINLSFCYLKLKIDGNVQWDRLKSLTIAGLSCLSADALNQVLCGAPLLEELVFAVREMSENFTIRSTSLKTLIIGREVGCYEIVTVYAGSVLSVWAPNLLTLKIWGKFYGGCLLEVPSLTNAALNLFECEHEIDSGDFSRIQAFNKVFQSVRHVENLTLSNWCIKFLLYMKMNGVLVRFSNAKFLNLFPDHPANEILDILQMFPNLMFLTAKSQYAQNGYSFASATTASIDHLKTIEIKWSVNDPSIFRVVQILLENGHMLERLVLHFNGLGVNEDQIFMWAQKKVLKMQRSSPTAEVVIIKSY